MTRRYLLTVAYDGTAYCGWQAQKNGPSVQETLEEALSRLLGRFTRVTGASRTDAGVHALGQRAHFDADTGIPAEKLPFALNTMLPPDVRVTAGLLVPDTLHARFSVEEKTYTYRIHNAPHASALYRNLTAHVPVTLDDRLMHGAAQALAACLAISGVTSPARATHVAKTATSAKIKLFFIRLTVLFQTYTTKGSVHFPVNHSQLYTESVRKQMKKFNFFQGTFRSCCL